MDFVADLQVLGCHRRRRRRHGAGSGSRLSCERRPRMQLPR